VYILQERSDLW